MKFPSHFLCFRESEIDFNDLLKHLQDAVLNQLNYRKPSSTCPTISDTKFDWKNTDQANDGLDDCYVDSAPGNTISTQLKRSHRCGQPIEMVEQAKNPKLSK